MADMDRDFKGVWIPKEVWLSTELTALEKMIYTEISSLDNDEHCNASNEYLAEFCQCSESKVSAAISKLIELGFIEKVSFDGRNRLLKIRSLTSKIKKSDYENLEVSIHYMNNIDENINKENNINSKSRKKQTREDKALELISQKLMNFNFSEAVEDRIFAFYQDKIDQHIYPVSNQLESQFMRLADEPEQIQLDTINKAIAGNWKSMTIALDNKIKNVPGYSIWQDGDENHIQDLTDEERNSKLGKTLSDIYGEGFSV